MLSILNYVEGSLSSQMRVMCFMLVISFVMLLIFTGPPPVINSFMNQCGGIIKELLQGRIITPTGSIDLSVNTYFGIPKVSDSLNFRLRPLHVSTLENHTLITY